MRRVCVPDVMWVFLAAAVLGATFAATSASGATSARVHRASQSSGASASPKAPLSAAHSNMAGGGMLFGTGTIESNFDTSSAGLAQVFPFRSRAAGTIRWIGVYVGAHDRAKRLVVGVYSTRGGQPGRLLTSGSIRAPQGGVWDTVKVRAAAIRDGAKYWLAVLGKGGTLYFRGARPRRCSGQTSKRTNLSSLPAFWKDGRRAKMCPISAYATSNEGGGLPPGVTLQPVDGGANYYCSSGFTYACNDGWDNPSFFPIGAWHPDFSSSSDVAAWRALGWNTALRTASPTSWGVIDAACASNGARCTGPWPIYVIEAGWAADCAGCTVGQPETPGMNPTDPAVVGLMTMDEADLTTFSVGITTPLSKTANSYQDHRFWWGNFTYKWVGNGGVDPIGDSSQVLASLITTPNGTQRHLDSQSLDNYWFANANANANTGAGDGGLGLVYRGTFCQTYGTCGQSFTAKQAQCGCRYGDLIDMERTYQTEPLSAKPHPLTCGQSGNPQCGLAAGAPIGSFIETGGRYLDTSGSDYIQPTELNWAVWGSIIHGARRIQYFTPTLGGPAYGCDSPMCPYMEHPENGASISMYAQVTATDTLVRRLATDINSAVANGYVRISPAAQTFSGVEARATYEPGQVPCAGTTSRHGCFTIFAETRYPESSPGNIKATFTTADGYTGPVEVVCDSLTGGDGDLNPGTCVNRTVRASNGVFTDRFAKPSTIHIYQIAR